MPTTVILGLKIPFKSLWEKVKTNKVANCSCPGTPTEYSFCPYCGIRKGCRSIKIYRSLVSGEETPFRNLNSILPALNEQFVDIYDIHPQGYTDEAVYIYCTNPYCRIEVGNTQRQEGFMPYDNVYGYKIEEYLREVLGDIIWSKGQYGLWVLEGDSYSELPEVLPQTNKKTTNNTNNGLTNLGKSQDDMSLDNIVRLIIPFNTRNDNNGKNDQ